MNEYVKGLITVRKNDGDFANMVIPLETIELTPDEYNLLIENSGTNTPFRIEIEFVQDEDGNIYARRSVATTTVV